MIKVLLKAKSILSLVSAEGELSFSELKVQTGLPKATLSHILRTLVEIGWLDKTSAGAYEVGDGIVHLAERRMRRGTLSEIAEEEVKALAERLHESVTVGVLHKCERFNLARATVSRSITVDANVVQRPSPYTTATGRVLLAHLDKDALAEVVEKKGLPGDGWREIRSRKGLTEALASIRKEGMAFALTEDGQVESVAVPIFGPDEPAWAAIGVSVPSSRFRGAQRKKILACLESAKERMEHAVAMKFKGVIGEVK